MRPSLLPFRKQQIITLAIFLTTITAICYNRCNPSKQYYTSRGIVWTTVYNITYESPNTLDDSIQHIFTYVDESASMFNKQSLISRINSGEEQQLDSLLLTLYNASVQVNKETDGAFDPTVSPLMHAWGFVKHGEPLPDSTTIDSILQFVGISKTSIANGNIIKEDPRTSFDFSAIAKGFACDEIGRMLRRNGVENYLVEIGGEIALQGKNSNGEAWRVSVDTPIEYPHIAKHENIQVVALTSGGIATSGNYRNFIEIEGKKVVHTMNPLTGYPESSRLLSATIITENCMLADAYATACMAMGFDRSRNFLSKRNDIAALLIFATDSDSLAMWKNNSFETFCVN